MTTPRVEQNPAALGLMGRLWRKTRMHAEVDLLFLASALGIAIGLLPFWAIKLGTIGGFITGIWTALYILLVAPGTIMCLMLLLDAFMVTTGRRARFLPVFKFIAENAQLQKQLDQAVPPAIRFYGRISATLGTWINPFTLAAILLMVIIEVGTKAAPATTPPPIAETQMRAFEARTFIVVQRHESDVAAIDVTGSYRLAGVTI